VTLFGRRRSDRPVLQALHLYREDTLPAAQEIAGRFGAS